MKTWTGVHTRPGWAMHVIPSFPAARVKREMGSVTWRTVCDRKNAALLSTTDFSRSPDQLRLSWPLPWSRQCDAVSVIHLGKVLVTSS